MIFVACVRYTPEDLQTPKLIVDPMDHYEEKGPANSGAPKLSRSSPQACNSG